MTLSTTRTRLAETVVLSSIQGKSEVANVRANWRRVLLGITTVLTMMMPREGAAAAWIRSSAALQVSGGTPAADISAVPGYDITPVIVSVAVGIGACIGIALFSRWARSRN